MTDLQCTLSLLDTAMTVPSAVDGLERASSIEDLLGCPVGRFFVGPTFAYFYPDPHFNGFSLWGSPSVSDIEMLNRLMDAVLIPPAREHVSLIDARGLCGVAPASFAVMGSYVVRRSAAFRAVIHRQALLRPAGLLGAVVAGFYDVVSVSYPTAVFTHLERALEWLGVGQGAGVTKLLDSLGGAPRSTDEWLDRFRIHLEKNHADSLSLEHAAEATGVSARTLQRRLQAAHTTFRTEVRSARVRAAQRLMITTDLSLTAIAFESGCASLQHFSVLFREVTGECPSQWKATRRPTVVRRIGSGASE